MPEIFDPTKESDKADKLFTQEAMEALEMANDELVKKIFRVSMNTLRTGDGHTRVSYTMANFSALLANLARQAEESTKETTKLNKRLLYLTWVITVFTAILLLVSFFEFPKITVLGNQGINQATQHTGQNKK